ncbi:uncharacterized protein LOC119300592 [Triticum dicoccoides]|uniref:uncharacterized protein LOC119300592 n=1 Tax=Triticum dicoccoides TaxID=85692 RepID=UPI00188FE56E|nr:uncharacterized protein LOC119300592 [Triticum dicoccoides]
MWTTKRRVADRAGPSQFTPKTAPPSPSGPVASPHHRRSPPSFLYSSSPSQSPQSPRFGFIYSQTGGGGDVDVDGWAAAPAAEAAVAPRRRAAELRAVVAPRRRRRLRRRATPTPRQSAPVRVPVWPGQAARPRDNAKRGAKKAEESDEDEEGGEEMVPPHVVAAWRSSSVLEGAGRTLKGRDLCRVRNAVLRQTGFLDL